MAVIKAEVIEPGVPPVGSSSFRLEFYSSIIDCHFTKWIDRYDGSTLLDFTIFLRSLAKDRLQSLTLPGFLIQMRQLQGILVSLEIVPVGPSISIV